MRGISNLIAYLQRAWTFSGRGSGVLGGKGAGCSGRGFWKRCRGGRWRGCAGSGCGAEDFVIVGDHELHEKGLVAGFQKSDHRYVPRHKGAQESGAENDTQVSWGHFVIFIMFCNPEEKTRGGLVTDLRHDLDDFLLVNFGTCLSGPSCAALC